MCTYDVRHVNLMQHLEPHGYSTHTLADYNEAIDLLILPGDIIRQDEYVEINSSHQPKFMFTHGAR